MFDALLPPPEYSRPYTGTLTVEYLHPFEVHKKCSAGRPITGRRIIGCAFVGDTWCHIVVPDDPQAILPLKYHDAIMRHELAHCNGWTHPPTYPTK